MREGGRERREGCREGVCFLTSVTEPPPGQLSQMILGLLAQALRLTVCSWSSRSRSAKKSNLATFYAHTTEFSVCLSQLAMPPGAGAAGAGAAGGGVVACPPGRVAVLGADGIAGHDLPKAGRMSSAFSRSCDEHRINTGLNGSMGGREAWRV